MNSINFVFKEIRAGVFFSNSIQRWKIWQEITAVSCCFCFFKTRLITSDDRKLIAYIMNIHHFLQHTFMS